MSPSPAPSSSPFSPSWLLHRLAKFPDTFSYCVALSGGADSVALLHALAQAGVAEDIRAIHVNHGLQAGSDQWQAHCRRLCQQLGIPLSVVAVSIDPTAGKGLEAAAREARYEVFRRQIKPGECLLMAHHLDDQAETVLMNLFQGAGPAGLAGIPAQRPLGEGFLVRPLLELRRAHLRAYASAQGLQWVDDPSNDERRFDRNYLRHEVMPRVLERWPQADSGIARAARHQGGLLAVEQATAQEALATCWLAGGELDLAAWQRLPAYRRSAALRLWLREGAKSVPTERQLQQLEADLLAARDDASPVFRMGNALLRRCCQRLYADRLSQPPVVGSVEKTWRAGEAMKLAEIGFFAHWVSVAGYLAAAGMQPSPGEPVFRLQFRRGGERIRLPGRAHHGSLKNLFQSLQVPSWKRDVTPLLFVGDELLLVWGYAVADVAAWRAALVQAGEETQ